MLSMDRETVEVAIANGSALSAEVALGARALHGIAMPAAWTAADLTFQASIDGGTTWLELTDPASGNAIELKAAADQYLPIDPTLWRAINMVKVRSGTSASAVNQDAERILTLVLRSAM